MNLKTAVQAEPLAGYLTFHTNDINRIAPATKRVSAQHRRKIRDDGPLSYQLNVAELDGFQVSWAQCNRDMEINVPQRCPFFMLHFLESGISRYSGPDLAVVNTPGNAVIVSPNPQMTIRHIAATAFSLVLPESLMIETLSEILGSTVHENLVFQPQIDLRSPVGRAIRGLFDFLVNDLDSPDSHMMNTPTFQAEFTKNMAGLLINGLDHNFSSRLQKNHPATGLGRVQMIEKYIRNHLDETLTLESMAQEACISSRALQKDFRKFRCSSPMAHLLKKRLEAVYQELLSPTSSTTVTEAAHKFGITSLGRFSGRYKDLFGESPSKTLARGKRGQTTL